MTRRVTRQIDGWHSPGQYAFSDLDADPGDRAAFLDGSTWPGWLFAASDAAGLAGFVPFDREGDAVTVGLDVPDRFDADEVRLSVARSTGGR